MVDKSLVGWEGRQWLQTLPRKSQETSFKILSYNILADYKCSFLHYSNTKNWDIRREKLISEITSYCADIVCLQDVDHYTDWWRPQLMLLGFDTIFKQRTEVKGFHYEGVLIAFKRHVFKLFKTTTIEFNSAVNDDQRGKQFRERSKTDDVGIILLLQPWSEDGVKSAICVCCAMLSDHISNSDVRMVQCNYLANEVEKANRDFQLPVVICLSMHDDPSSLSYTSLTTGRIPLAGQIPKKCLPPTCYPTCRGSVLLKWLPPPSSLADPPLLSFRIAWRPGGSRILAFRSQIEVAVGDCVKYAEVVDEHRDIRMVALPQRQFTISGLVSDMPYEFKIVAVNEVGEGVWSDVSKPVAMENPKNVK